MLWPQCPDHIFQGWHVRWCFFSPGHLSIRVLCGNSSTSGGAEAQVAYLAAELARLGHEVALIYGVGKAEAPPRSIAGVLCIDAAPEWRRPRSLVLFWGAMTSVSPDVLYARLPSDFLWMMGAFARSTPQARFIYALAHDLHARAWSAYGHRKWVHAPLYGLGLRSAEAIAIQHQGQTALVSQRLHDRLSYVPNLVRSCRARPRDYAAALFDVIWIAKIRPEKRLDVLLDLAAALPDRRFAVIGGFDPFMSAGARRQLEQRTESLPNVALLGPKRADEVLALLGQSRVLVNTSDSEGFPNSMLEAWSSGVPVVSLSVDPGGVIEREKLGFVAGTPAKLLERVYTLVLSGAINREMGCRGLDYVKRQHSPERVIEALLRAARATEIAPLLRDHIRTTGNRQC